MNPILLKALDQMERGMASQEGRAQVNAETMADRAGRAEALEARREASERMPAPQSTVKAMTDKEFTLRMQSGYYGSLD